MIVYVEIEVNNHGFQAHFMEWVFTTGGRIYIVYNTMEDLTVFERPSQLHLLWQLHYKGKKATLFLNAQNGRFFKTPVLIAIKTFSKPQFSGSSTQRCGHPNYCCLHSNLENTICCWNEPGSWRNSAEELPRVDPCLQKSEGWETVTACLLLCHLCVSEADSRSLEQGTYQASEGLIEPKKLPNPVKESRHHQELHRELLFTHRRWVSLYFKESCERFADAKGWFFLGQ